MDIKAKENNLTDSIKQKETNIFGVISRIHNPNAVFIKNINTDGTITAEYLDGEVTTFNNKNLDPYYEEVVDSETNKRFRKLKPQIVSELTQKPVEQLTDDDFNNVANYFQQQTVSELVRGNNKNGVLDKSIFESNLNIDENNELNIPLNINGQDITLPINSASQSDKNINRYKELLQKDPNTLSESELTEKKAIEDIAINDAITARQQYNINEKYNALDVSKLNLTMENRDIKITPTLAKSMTTGEYWATFAGKSFKEGLAAVSTGILGLFDYYENEQEREAHKADIVGYVPQSYRVAEQQAMEKAMAAMERGDILEAAWHAKFQVLPEIAQEVGELLVTAIAMGAVTAATGGLGGAAAAVVTGAKLSKAISKASKIGLTLSKYLVAPVATSADQYLTGVATYEANNNEPMSLARRSAYMLGLAMTNAVDLALIKQAGKIALGTAHKAVDSITDPVKKKMAKGALARYATATLGGGAGEGLQEYVQQIFDTSMTQNQADGKTLIEIALDPETQFSALIGAMVGGTVGAGANAVGDTLGKTFQGIEAGAKAIGSGISSVSSSIANNKAGVNNSKNVVQGLSSIEKSISLANDSDTIAQAETLVSNFKANVDNGNYDINENDIHRINTLEAKLALKKEAVQSGSIAAYTKDSSAFIKDFIMDFNDTVSDFATATDPTTFQQQYEFLLANRGKIKALKNYIAQGIITVDKETKNALDSAEQTFNEFYEGYIDSAEPDNDFIEELLNDKEDRFFYMYENANEEQKQKLAEIASQDQDLKHLIEKDKNGKINIKKSLADVRIETTKGKHGTNTYSEAINFYNKKLIRLERKAKKEDLTPKEERQKIYYEGKISSYKNTVIHFLDTQVKKLKEFADIYKYPKEEDIIDPETKEKIGVIIGRYEGVNPQGEPSSFGVNKGDNKKAPSKSGSGKVIAETIDNLKRMNRLLKKRYIPTETKNDVKQSLQDANEAIEKINGVLLASKKVAKSDLHEYIQIGNRRTQNTPSEATKSSTINDNKKQVENTTKEEKTIVEAKKDTTEESTKKEETKETKTEPKQEVVNENKEETNVIDTQDNKIEELNTIEEQDNQNENTTTTDDNTDNNIKENDIEKSIKEIEEEIANSKTVDELSDKTIDDMIDSIEDISTNSEGMADHDIGTRYFKGTVWYLYKYLIDRLNYKLRKRKYNKDKLTRDDKIALYSLWFFLKLHNTMPFTPKGRVKTMLDIRDPLFTKFLKRITGKNFISYDDLRKYHPYYWEKIIVKKDTEVDIAKDRKVRKKSVEEIIAEIEENIKKDDPKFAEYMKIEKPTGNKELLKRNLIHIPVWYSKSKKDVAEGISRYFLDYIGAEQNAVLIKMQENTIPIVDYLLKRGVPVVLLGSYNEEFVDYYKKLPDNLKNKVCTIHISHNNKVKFIHNPIFYSHTVQQELMSALANVIYDFFPQDNYNILWNKRTANIVLVEKTDKSKKNTQTKEENNKEQTETTNKETKPEPVEEENKLESVEEEITPEPIKEEPESDIVEEKTQQVNTEDENTETDSTSSNKEKLDTLLRNIGGRVNRLIELGAIFSDDDYIFLEEFDNDFSRISDYKRYVKRHGVEFVKANYMHLIKEVFDKYDSSPYEELDDDYIDDLDESTINNYFEFLENLMFEIRDEIISKSRNEFEKLYKDKTPSEYWDKIFTNPTIDDLKELQSFIENLVASENRYLDGRMSKEADERFHIVKNEINDYLEDLDNEDTDTTSEEVEENTLSEATESSVNEDNEEEVDNTTEEESLVTEPENDVYVEENEEVVQEHSTTEENKRKNIDEINAELPDYSGEEHDYLDTNLWENEEEETNNSLSALGIIKKIIKKFERLKLSYSIRQTFQDLLAAKDFDNDTFNKGKNDKVFIGDNYTLNEEDLKGVKYIFINLFFGSFYVNNDRNKVKQNIKVFIEKIQTINKNRPDSEKLVFVLPPKMSDDFKSLFDFSGIDCVGRYDVPRAEKVRDFNTVDLVVGFQGLEYGYNNNIYTETVLLAEGTFTSRIGTNTGITTKTITIFSDPKAKNNFSFWSKKRELTEEEKENYRIQYEKERAEKIFSELMDRVVGEEEYLKNFRNKKNNLIEEFNKIITIEGKKEFIKTKMKDFVKNYDSYSFTYREFDNNTIDSLDETSINDHFQKVEKRLLEIEEKIEENKTKKEQNEDQELNRLSKEIEQLWDISDKIYWLIEFSRENALPKKKLSSLYNKIYQDSQSLNLIENMPKSFSSLENVKTFFTPVMEKLRLISTEKRRQYDVRKFQNSNTAIIKQDSVFNFNKLREIKIRVGGKTITFNSINHAISSLIHNTSADSTKWYIDEEEYLREYWDKNNNNQKFTPLFFDIGDKLDIANEIITQALKYAVLNDNELRSQLVRVFDKKRKYLSEPSKEYLALEEKLEEIQKKGRSVVFGSLPYLDLAEEYYETLQMLNYIKIEEGVNLTEFGVENFLEYFIDDFSDRLNISLTDIDQYTKEGKPILFHDTLTNHVEIAVKDNNKDYKIIPTDFITNSYHKEILNLLYTKPFESTEDRIAEWKSFFNKFTPKNEGTFNKENPDVNKVTTTFEKNETPVFEITTTKNKQEGGYIYKLTFLPEDENGLEIEFNSHPILATKTKDHSMSSRDNIRTKYTNKKDEEYKVKNLREDIDNKKELIKQLKSLWFGLNFFRDNFDSLAIDTLANKIEMIDKYLKNKVAKLEKQYPTIKKDLKTVGIDIDSLLAKSNNLRNDITNNFNDDKVFSVLEEQLSTIGQAIDKYSLDIKTKESQIKATYKAENAKKEEEKPNKIEEKIKEYIKKTFKLNESKSHYFAIIEYQKLFNENPVEFVYTLLKEIDNLSIKITKAKQLLLTDDLNTKIEEVKQLLQTDDPILNKTEISNAKLNYEERLEVLKKIREVVKIPAQVNISDEIKEKTDKESIKKRIQALKKQKELLDYVDSIYLIASDIEEALDDLLIKNLIPEFVNQETKETYLHKIEGQFIVALKTKEATTILPTTEEFSEENARIKKELENLFNIYKGAKVENEEIVEEGIVKDNAAYTMLTNIPNFALAVDFAVAELFYTNTKILNDPTVYMSSVIDDLGKSVLNALGLQLNPATTSLALENQIIQDIGYLALNYAENMGYVETGNVSINGMATNAVKNTTNEYDREVLNHKYELLTTKPKRKSGTYSFVKEELPKRRERNPESESLQDANKKLMATPFRVNYEAIDLIEQNRYSVQRALGWLTEEEIQDLPTKDLQISQVGINQQIEKSIDELITLKKEAELNGDNKPEYIYFNTFSATNTRMHIDSSTINPQNDKLHRFLFSPVSEEEDLTKEKTINSDLLIQQFTYAIGQGLGLPVDKNTNEERVEWFKNIKTHLIGNKNNIDNLKKALLSNNKAEIEKIGKEIELPIEVEEFGHFLQALLVLEDTRIEKDGSVVVGAKGVQFLTVEHDSASSGLVIRILASGVFAFNGLDELNKALGVYTKEKEEVDSRNAFFKTKGAVDVYQTAAVDLKEDTIDTPENMQELAQNSFRAGYKGLPVDRDAGEQEVAIRLPFVTVKINFDTKSYEITQDKRKDMFNDLKSFLGFSKDGKVSKALRSFMKSLVMPFGYQIGFRGALETATKEYINDLMLKFMRVTTDEERTGRNNFLDRILPYFEGVNNNVFSIDVKAIKITENMSDSEKAKARELFLKLLKHVKYKDLNFKVPITLMEARIESESLDSNATFSLINEDLYEDINFSDIIQHTVMYMYTGTLYENLRQKFGELRGSAVFNSLVNQFSAEYRIKKLIKNDYIRKDKNGIHLAYKQVIKQEDVEQLNRDKKSGKVIAIKLHKYTDPKPVSKYSTVSETTIKRIDLETGKPKNVKAYEIIFTSPLLNMPAKEARKILSGTGLDLTGLSIHSSPEIYLDAVEVELKKTSNSDLAMKAVKTEMPIGYKEQNLAHTKIQLDNRTETQSNVTKALAVPLDVSITGSGARLAAVTIHNLDAEIMAHTINKNVGQVLPVFDAIVSSPFAVKDSSTALNEGIYQVAMETSIEDRSLAAINRIVSDNGSYVMEDIIINVAEAQLVEKYLTKLGINKAKIKELLVRKTTKGNSKTALPLNSVEISMLKYQEMLETVTKKVKELKEKNKNTVTVANVDGIDGTAYSKTKTKAPNQNPKTNDDVYNYFYSQGTEDDKNDFEDVMFSDNDAEARLNLFDTLVGDSHVDTTGWFSQVKELLQSLGSLRLNSLGVSLVEGLGIYGEYNKSNHTVYLERSTIPNTSDRYRHPAIRYAHELIHAIMATALDQASKLGITKEVGQLFDLYNIASKHLTPEDFLPEYYNNYEEAIQEAKATYDYIFSNSLENNKRLRGLNEFIAYALTDERLARKLQSILIQQKSDKKQSLWSRLKEIIRTIFNIAKPEENKDLDGLMANLVDLFKENKDLNAFEALQNLVQKIVDADNKAMQQAEEQNQFSGIKKLIYTAGEKAIIPANKTIGGFIQNLITLTDNITNYDKLMSTLQNETGEYNLRTRLIATSKILLNVLTSSKARKKLPQVLNYIGLTTFASYNFAGRWIDEMKEADEYKRTIEDKARASRKIDQNAQGIKNITISQLTELFKDENRPNGLSEEEKAMLTDIVLKLDLSCLKKRENGKDIPITADDLKNLMTDNEKIDETISSLRKELLDITQDETLHYDSKTRTLLLNKITMLADYLATGNVYITGATNARSVRQSVESDKNVNNRNRKAREIENLIDQLASLMALKQIPLSNRQQIASMSTDGLDAFINIHRTNKENDYDYYVQISGTSEKNIPFAKAYDNLSKGFTKVISNNSYDVIIGYANQAEFYNQKGFKPIPDVIAGEIGGEKLLYYKNGFNSRASRNGAAYVYTGFNKIGKSMMLIAEEELQFKDTGLNFAGMSNAYKIRRLADEYTARVGKQAKALTAPLSDKELTIEELRNLNKNYKNVYPVYNQHGGVQDYNIIPPKEVKKQLSITDDAFRILGEMVATNLRREQGSELNKELLDFIFKESDIFSSLNARPDANFISHDNDNNRWIPIIPDSFDPFARQMWEELDSNLRQYILTYMKATNKPLYIREDALLDVFGQKDIAVSNVITRNLPVFRQAIQVLGMIAKFVATEYKGLVVIKTPQVLIGNVLSNVALALVQGINPIDIIKSYVSDFRAIQDYEKTDKRLKELQFKVNITNDTKKKLEINREIEILKSKLQNNSVHELMNLGYKQTIVEDISNTDFDNSSYFDSKIERARKTLPRPLLAGFDILFMTKRTAGYQFMHKMTGYSDLLARSVEYKHKKKQIEKKYKIGTEEYEEAMYKLHGQLADNYINYDKPQSAVEQWLNDMGLVLFTKFFKRIQSVIVNHVIDNPLGVAAFLTANTVVDVPNIFETSIAVRDLTAYTHNPVDFIGELITPPLLNLLSNDNKMQDV